MRGRRAVTLIEVMLAVVIGAVLSVALTRLLSSGMRISQKGAAQLTNVQNAAILAAQIERDLERADTLTPGPDADGAMTLEILTPTGPARVIYRLTPNRDGVSRIFQAAATGGPAGGSTPAPTPVPPGPPATGGADGPVHVFCRGMFTGLQWRWAEVGGRVGLSVRIIVRTAMTGGEEFRLQRFYHCPNLPDNRSRTTGDWLW